MRAEKLIIRYNHLNGKSVSKTTLAEFHNEITGELAGKRIDSHSPLGIEVIGIEKRLSNALKKIKGDRCKIVIDKPINVKSYISVQKKVHLKKSKPAGEFFDGLELDNDTPAETSLGNLNDVYEMITNMILEAIKKGGLIWRKPWNSSGDPKGRAHNYVTKRYYSGANSYLNWYPPLEGYKSPYFFTMNQIDKLGGKVVKGGKMWPVVYYKELFIDQRTKKSITDEYAKKLIRSMSLTRNGGVWYNAKGEAIIKTVPAMFYYGVFNYEDTTGLNVKPFVPVKRTEVQKIESAEAIVENMPKKPEIKYGGDRAYYSPSQDFVQIPLIGTFKKEQHFYSVQFHELVHSTGHESRVSRNFGRKGTPEYDQEELIAELGASFLCGESGILFHTMNDHASYLDMYQKSLSNDAKFFFRASAGAQKAADFIIGKSKEKKEVKETVVENEPNVQPRESKRSRPPVERKESSKATTVHSKKSKSQVHGFFTADQKPPKAEGKIYTLFGEMGKFLGEQQRYRSQIIITGEKHSSKSEFVKQLADAFIDRDFKVALVDYEMGGLNSKDTMAGIERNLKPGNIKKLFVAPDDFPTTVEAIKGIGNAFDVIIIDSGTKLGMVTNEWLDELRTEFPDTIWVVLLQQNSKGTAKGGSAAGFNAPVVIETYHPDPTTWVKNYAWIEKNRGNMTDKWYMITQHRVVFRDPGIVNKVKA